MIKVIRNTKHVRGFSLLEVLIAVVVLSTGLLALAALQGGLTRASADSKVRGRIAAVLATRMEGLRNTGYLSAAMAVGTNDLNCVSGSPAWLCEAEAEAGLSVGALTISQSVATWTTTGTGPFVVGTPAALTDPQFKRVQLEASWTDANGDGTRRLALSTDISPLGLEEGLLPPPDEFSSDSTRPIARFDDPAGLGVIPVAMSATGQDTAATNPKPEILGQGGNQAIVGTRFSVLTYTNEGSSTARLQKRVDNEVIRCRCKYGALTATRANGTPIVPQFMRAPQWPAVWTGTKYEVFVPASVTAPAGVGPNAGEDPAAIGEQSENCTACCRDHHDASAKSPKFDPERALRAPSDQQNHYSRVSDTLVIADRAAGDAYLEVCRMVLVDGVIRTAADLYNRHFGLLETTTGDNPNTPSTVESNVGANGVPNVLKAATYGDFVKEALAQWEGVIAPISLPSPAPANTDKTNIEPVYVKHGLAKTTPEKISIAAPRPVDERYLHARGLYLDYLEPAARTLINEILADTAAGGRCDGTLFAGANRIECILPYLPIAAINLTELAFWQPENADPVNYYALATDDDSVLTVQSASALIYNPTQPFRGRVNARAVPADPDGEAASSIGKSNAGVAISAAIDPDDESTEGVFVDKQLFTVGGATVPTNGDKFAVALFGLPQTADNNTSNDPALAWATSTEFGNCGGTVSRHDDNPNNYVCNTTVDLGDGSITVSSYYREYTVSASQTVTCSFNGTPKSVTATLDVPTFADYAVSSAQYFPLGNAAPQSVQGTFDSPREVNPGTKAESTRISFSPLPSELPANDPTQFLIHVNFGTPAILTATVTSCETNNSGSQVRNIVWSKPWE